MARADDFFLELDALWTAPRTKLRIIGASALLLRTGHDLGTKDSDVLEAPDLDATARDLLGKLAGPDSTLCARHKIYVQLVASGLPFLPQAPLFHESALNTKLTNVALFVLDPVDVLVSKLKVFRPADRADIDAMIERGFVTHAKLLERFRAAVDWHAHAADADALPKCVDNLHAVERDSFGVEESQIELPDWISD